MLISGPFLVPTVDFDSYFASAAAFRSSKAGQGVRGGKVKDFES